ncbi:MAG: hypothetical protein RLZZ293_939 [Pseudomonadota bacterium]|jgi:osmotically-inducible protein OsmY
MKIFRLVVSSCILFGLVACSTQDATRVSDNLTAPYLTDSDNQRNDDIALENRLERELNKLNSHNKIKLVVTNSNVLLVGQVVTEEQKSSIQHLIEEMPNVKQIFNYLTVTINPKLNENNSINKQAIHRVNMQNDIIAKNLKIITVDNIVYIMGSNVGNLTSLDLAVNGIYSIHDVKKVVNLEQKGHLDYVSQ